MVKEITIVNGSPAKLTAATFRPQLRSAVSVSNPVFFLEEDEYMYKVMAR